MGDAHLFGITHGIQCLKASPPLPLHKMTMASIKNYEFFKIHLSPYEHIWVPNSSRKFTTKFTYLIPKSKSWPQYPTHKQKSEWKFCIRFKLMLCKIAWDVLLTKANLAAQTTSIDNFCILRNVEEETTFFTYSHNAPLPNRFGFPLPGKAS